MSAADRKTAAHEAGHAVAAYLLGRTVDKVSIDGWMRDLTPPARERRPHWHALEDDVVIAHAGVLSEHLTDSPTDAPKRDLPTSGRETVTAGVKAVDTAHAAPLSPPGYVWSDAQLADSLVRGLTGSDDEHRALSLALWYRAERLTEHPHFRALHHHLTEALQRDRHMNADDVRVELGRAELRYSNTTPKEHEHGPTRTAA